MTEIQEIIYKILQLMNEAKGDETITPAERAAGIALRLFLIALSYDGVERESALNVAREYCVAIDLRADEAERAAWGWIHEEMGLV